MTSAISYLSFYPVLGYLAGGESPFAKATARTIA
jgi:hypothetical protein